MAVKCPVKEGDEHGAAVTLDFVLPEFTTH